MKAQTIFAVWIGAGFLWAQPPSPNYRAEILWETAIGPIPRWVNHLVAVCPSGMSIVHTSAGGVIVMDSQGAIVARQSGIEALEDATACTCDSRGRLFVGVNGNVRVFQVSPSGQLLAGYSFYVAGIARRMVVSGEVLYILGYATLDRRPALLRRYSLPDGRFLGTLTPDCPVHVGAANNIINSFATEGSLSLLPAGGEILYVPVNPLEFSVFDPTGRQVRVKRPAVPHFENVDHGPWSANRPDWRSVDWVFNAVPGPFGQTIVHVLKRGDLPGAPAAAPYSHLKIFDSAFDLVADNIRVGTQRFPGLLIGADANGDLYFALLSVPQGGAILKVRVAAQ